KRPAVVRENRIAWLERHAAVDQRGPAKPAARHDGNVAADMEVEHSRCGPMVTLGRVELDLTQCGRPGIRVFAWMQFLASLQDADTLSGRRAAGGVDPPAISGANDDHRIAL